MRFDFYINAPFSHQLLDYDDHLFGGEIMQYTWLKDKNWKEIYEWDILKWQSWASNTRYDFWIVPEWNDNAWAYCIHDQKYWSWSGKDSHVADSLSNRNAIYKFEIVWNIYETPDLIK